MSLSRESKAEGAFSERIISRIHNWVHKTTSQTRDNDSTQHVGAVHQQLSNHVKDNMNIKKNQRRRSEAVSADSRTIEELEEALKELISNCVTNQKVLNDSTSDEPKPLKSDAVQDNTQSLKETNQEHVSDDCLLEQGKDRREDDITCCKSQKTSSDKMCMTTSNGVKENSSLYCQNKQRFTSKTQTEPNISRRNSRKEYDQISSVFKPDERHYHNDRGPNNNHSSKNVETFGVNTSTSNVNRGLPTGNSIKKKIHQVSKTGWNFLHHSHKSKTTEAKENDDKVRVKKKAPLRRIHSDGDAIMERFTFHDSDVDAFAETCIRHAMKKRLSEVGSVEGDFDHFSLQSSCETDIDKHLSENDEYDIEKEKPVVIENSKDISSNESNQADEPGKEDFLDCEIFSPTGQKDLRITQNKKHTSLFNRPNSLSFPMDIRKSPLKSPLTATSSVLTHKSRSPQSLPCSPEHTTMSPKFRKFPCHPTFFVPSEVSSPPRDMTKKGREQSLIDNIDNIQLKQTEYFL